MDAFYKRLLDGNKAWVSRKLKEDSNFFEKLSKGQSPPLMWVGCSDSRVPANEVTDTQPGEVFVHRNIANVVSHTDINLLSVLEYAVNVLKVKHIIVCGHYGCGGVVSALSNKSFGFIDNWLRHIKDVYRLHQEELDALKDLNAKENRLVELNVIESVFNLCKTSVVQSAWEENRELYIHGWVYDVKNGIAKDLNVNIKENKELTSIYRIDF